MIVIFSTLNGRRRLDDMLEAMLRVRIPPGTTIHVVDNGSTDGTQDLLRAYSDRLPITLYSQPVRGKNVCLNLAVNTLAGTLAPDELIVFTDDDVLPSPEWLEELGEAGKAHPDCTVFAGRVLPHWPNSDIAQLDPVRQHFGILFSLTTETEGPCRSALAWGPNMAVRASVFQRGLLFDPRFGPNGGDSYPMGSETELMERLDASGHRAWFASRACVRHMIRPSQLDVTSVLQRAFRHGYGVGWRHQRGRGGWHVLSYMLKAARGITAARLQRFMSPARSHLLHDFHEAWALGCARGALYEFRRARAGRRFRGVPTERPSGEPVPVQD